MRLCLIASGSKGNCLYVETAQTKLLIDAGLSAREIIERLGSVGINPAELNGIIITHEHGDHIKGAGALARKLKIPAIISYPTHRVSSALFRKTNVIEFESGYPFAFRDISIDPFPITHDATDPVGFVIESGEGKIGIATDLGIATRLVADKLKGCTALVLETNHDEEMLINGPYPWHLKQRIKSRHGHLSNVDAAALLDELLHDGLKGLFLAHLSEVNNDPNVALEVVQKLVSSRNICSPTLQVGNQYAASAVFSY